MIAMIQWLEMTFKFIYTGGLLIVAGMMLTAVLINLGIYGSFGIIDVLVCMAALSLCRTVFYELVDLFDV